MNNLTINSGSSTIVGTSSNLILGSNSTGNSTLITDGTTSWSNQAFIGGGINNNTSVGTTKYTLYGVEFEMQYGLTNSDIMFLVNIEMNGYRFYEMSIEKGIDLTDEFKHELEPIIKLMKRSETIGEVLKNKDKK